VKRKTKPISDGGQLGANRTNKANSGSRPGVSRAKCAKQSQTWVLWGIWGTAHPGSLSCQTKPICQRCRAGWRPVVPNKANSARAARRDTVWRRGSGSVVQTKPIPAARIPHRSTILSFRPDTDRATSPRCPASGNKPNLVGADCAKRTQFATRLGGRGERTRLCRTKPIGRSLKFEA
jgi:hypothetical protein